MDDHSIDNLRVLGQLAREYQEKYRELEEILQCAQPNAVIRQLGSQGELTTDRFRAAQQVLMPALPLAAESEEPETSRALTTLYRCFDEMRILFQILLERFSESTEQKPG